GEVPPADVREAGVDGRRPEQDRLPLRLRLLPDVVERGEVELALGGEVAIEDRLGDAGGARDLRRRRPVVAPLGEEADRGLDEVPPAVGGRHPRRGDSHAASSAMCSRTTSGRVRTVTTATIAAAKLIAALTASPAWSPLTESCAPASVCCW